MDFYQKRHACVVSNSLVKQHVPCKHGGHFDGLVKCIPLDDTKYVSRYKVAVVSCQLNTLNFSRNNPGKLTILSDASGGKFESFV